MKIDFSIVGQIVSGLVLLFAGALIHRVFERRARLIIFYGHVGQFRLQPQSTVHTHSVVIRNTGRLAAHNVHMPHNGLLTAANIHVSIEPPIAHTVQKLANNTEEIFFRTLPAKSQVTVSYLYFPPLLVNQINAPIYSDEGPAKVITMLPQQQLPKWLLAVMWALMFIGLVTICYGTVGTGTLARIKTCEELTLVRRGHSDLWIVAGVQSAVVRGGAMIEAVVRKKMKIEELIERADKRIPIYND